MLDSEQFRSGPKDLRPFCDRPGVAENRAHGLIGGLIAHNGFIAVVGGAGPLFAAKVRRARPATRAILQGCSSNPGIA